MELHDNNGLFTRVVKKARYDLNAWEEVEAYCTYAVGPDGQPTVKILQWVKVVGVVPMTESELEHLGIKI